MNINIFIDISSVLVIINLLLKSTYSIICLSHISYQCRAYIGFPSIGIRYKTYNDTQWNVKLTYLLDGFEPKHHSSTRWIIKAD